MCDGDRHSPTGQQGTSGRADAALGMQVERLHPGLTTGSQLLLQKGRRLTEQTLNSCQLKRLRANTVRSSTDTAAAM